MELLETLIFASITLVWLWMSILGVLAAKYDQSLTAFQKKGQITISIMIPFFGAALVLHLVHHHSPEAIPRSLVPWPLKSLVFPKHRLANKNRDENRGIATWGSSDHRKTGGGDSSSGGSD